MNSFWFPLPLNVREMADGSRDHFETESDFLFIRRGTFALYPDALKDFKPACPADFVLVPQGFRTDFASVPAMLRFVFEVDNLVAPGALVHDWLYESQLVDRATADAIFLAALRLNGVSSWKARMYWLGVRAGGWTQWGKRSGAASDALELLAQALDRRGL